MSAKPKKLYYSISEVSEMMQLKQYVLRYWETEFSNLHPSKNKAGNRIYRETDIQVVAEIKRLLYERKFTIEGARQFFKKKDSAVDSPLEKSDPTDSAAIDLKVLKDLQTGLEDLLKLIQGYKKN